MKNNDLRKLFDHSISQWCYGGNGHEFLPCSFRFGDADIWHTETAKVQVARTDNVEVAIIGECVDVREGHDANKIAEGLSMIDCPAFEKEIENLCGGYVIFRRDRDDIRVYGDAIHMMSVYYGVNRYAGVVASCEALIVDDPSEISPVSAKVLSGAYETGLYLAGDMTMYDDVKALLPNHYLSLSEGRSIRYFPREELKLAKTEAEVDEIVDNTIKMVERCIRQLAKRMEFASPLTPGGDSRLNCAFINNQIPQEDVLYYVIQTKEMESIRDNTCLVEKLAREFKFDEFHFYPEAEAVSGDRVADLRRILGPIREWRRKIWAYHPDVGSRTIASGALIGHVLGGKLAMNLPEWLAGVWFLKVAQRNVSRIAGKEVGRWYDDVKSAIRMGYSKFDMWYWEIRCGRWNANTISRDDLIGIRDINFYNAHRIINEWCRIPRHLRVRKLIHKRLLKKLYPSVADIEFNPCACRGGRVSSPFWDKIIPVWCRSTTVYILEAIRRRGAI